jgi:hypothetical protein
VRDLDQSVGADKETQEAGSAESLLSNLSMVFSPSAVSVSPVSLASSFDALRFVLQSCSPLLMELTDAPLTRLYDLGAVLHSVTSVLRSCRQAVLVRIFSYLITDMLSHILLSCSISRNMQRWQR